MLLAACLALLIVTLALLGWPLLRRRPAAAETASAGVYRDQLSELDHDLARGAITAADAAAARIEISRRLLATSAANPPEVATTPSPPLAAAILVVAAAGAVSLYIGLGAPSLRVVPAPDTASIENLPPEQRAAAFRTMVERLAARLDGAPDDAEGWLRLGRAWLMLGESEKSAAAYARAGVLRPDDAEAPLQELAALLDATPMGASLPPRIPALVATVTRLAPDRPEALWYLGLAAARLGQRDAALAYWQRLLPLLPAEAEERRLVQTAIDAIKGR